MVCQIRQRVNYISSISIVATAYLTAKVSKEVFAVAKKENHSY